jgi:hypothetical protein
MLMIDAVQVSSGDGSRFCCEVVKNTTRASFEAFAITLFVWLIRHQPVVLFSQNKPATNNQPAVLFSQNKSAPATRQTNRLYVHGQPPALIILVFWSSVMALAGDCSSGAKYRLGAHRACNLH